MSRLGNMLRSSAAMPSSRARSNPSTSSGCRMASRPALAPGKMSFSCSRRPAGMQALRQGEPPLLRQAEHAGSTGLQQAACKTRLQSLQGGRRSSSALMAETSSAPAVCTPGRLSTSAASRATSCGRMLPSFCWISGSRTWQGR